MNIERSRMGSIKKLPIYLSIVFAIITGLSALLNGKDFSRMAMEVSIAIAAAYAAGMIIKYMMLKLAKELLEMSYAKEIRKRPDGKIEK